MATRSVPVPFLRSAFNYDVDAASVEAGLHFGDERTKTQLQFQEECDINVIVKRFGLTGQMPDDVRMPMSGDFTEVVDFQTAMNQVVAAQREFLRIPAELRERFANDPQRLIAFLGNDANRDEAIKLGLLPKPPEVDRTGAPAAAAP